MINLILHTLKSNLLMLRNNDLPPFIYPRMLSLDFNNDDIDSLSNCISLVHMISGEMRGSRKLFWRKVRQECNRLC